MSNQETTGGRDRSAAGLACSVAAAVCVLCAKRESRRGYACRGCLNDLVRILRELGEYLSLLTLLTQPPRGQTGRLSPGYGSRSPAADDVLVALDPRSLPGDVDEHGDAIMRRPCDTARWVRSLWGSVRGVAEWIADERHEPSTLYALDYIRRNLDWCAQQFATDDDGKRHPWVDELADDLRELHRDARRLAHDQPQEPLGECLTVTCNGDVFEGGPAQPARCRECRRPYDGLDLIRLGVAQAAA